MRRRQFLKSAGCFVASAGVLSLIGCNDEDGSSSGGSYTFPQSVASGDPQPESVLLWTRVLPSDAAERVSLRVTVSEREDLSQPIVQMTIEASRDNDYTVRVYVQGLTADRTYYYRFNAGSDESRVGRTRTAPNADADVEPRFAWAACQDYEANFYGAYSQLLERDRAAPPAEQLHFVLFVGDFIYETRSADFMQAIDDDLQPKQLKNADGTARTVPAFPSGGGTRPDGTSFAKTLDDYRHLYKHYLTDPTLQAARERWPFVQVWDDHEFSDDCWQTQANYTRDASTDEPSQQRRVAASQAWFEFIPAALSDAQTVADEAQPAKDFAFVAVSDAAYDQEVEVDEPNNQKALAAITIYRHFRWGKHLELVITDNRSYRSDQALAEEATKSNPLIFDPRVALPKIAVDTMDAGRDADGGKPPDSVQGITNTRKNSPPGTMLGAEQKAWWKRTLKNSDATFKVWANSVPLLRFLLDRREVQALLPSDLLLSDDAWDGYNTERKELMAYLRDEGILNVVSLSGDHHAHYAGLVLDDYDAEDAKPVMVDIATAGIASNSQWSAVASVLTSSFSGPLAAFVEPVKELIVYDSTPFGGTSKAVVNLNTLIRYGSPAAKVAASTHDLAKIEAARLPGLNAHLRYADAHAFGYGIAHVTADALTATLVTSERSFEDPADHPLDPRGTATFTVPRVEQLSDLQVAEPELTGRKPFPLALS